MKSTTVQSRRALRRSRIAAARLDQMRRELSRRQVRRRFGDDPTSEIRSRSDALDTAHALLDAVTPRDTEQEVWASVAEAPLAELLLAASTQRGLESGMRWAWRALVDVEAPATVPGWRQAAQIWEQQAGAALPSRLLDVAQLLPRQRQSVIVMMIAAMDPWLPVTSPRISPSGHTYAFDLRAAGLYARIEELCSTVIRHGVRQ